MTTFWEPARLANWLYDTLEPDTTLRSALGGAGRIFDTDVPQGNTADMYVILQLLSGQPIVCLGPTRAGLDTIYLVKVVGKAKAFSVMAPALDRVEALLFGADVTTGGWHFTHDERPGGSAVVAYAEPTVGGTVYRHAGRAWPFFVRAA